MPPTFNRRMVSTSIKGLSLLVLVMCLSVAVPAFSQTLSDTTQPVASDSQTTREIIEHQAISDFYTIETHLKTGIHRVMADESLVNSLIGILETTSSYQTLSLVSKDQLKDLSPVVIITPPNDSEIQGVDALDISQIINVSAADITDLFNQLNRLKQLNETMNLQLNNTNFFLYSLFNELNYHMTAQPEDTQPEESADSVVTDEMDETDDSTAPEATLAEDEEDITQEKPAEDIENEQEEPTAVIEDVTEAEETEVVEEAAVIEMFTLGAILNETQSSITLDYESGGNFMDYLGRLTSFAFITDSLEFTKDEHSGELTFNIPSHDGIISFVAYSHQIIDQQVDSISSGSMTPNDHLSAFYVSTEDWMSADHQHNLMRLNSPELHQLIDHINTIVTTMLIEAHNNSDELSDTHVFSYDDSAPELSPVECVHTNVGAAKIERIHNVLKQLNFFNEENDSFSSYRKQKRTYDDYYHKLLAFDPNVMTSAQMLLQEHHQSKIHIMPGEGEYINLTKVCAVRNA